LVHTSPVVATIQRAIHPPGLAIRPAGGGSLLLHGDAYDPWVTPDLPMLPPPAVATELVQAVRPYVRYMEAARAETATVGIRPIPADGFSAVGWVPGIDGLYVLVTHSGVTLAPFLAELATREVQGAVEPLLVPFRPDRLL
jgi:glycine/D-amino acid oxidase-like deaminating enzyme